MPIPGRCAACYEKLMQRTCQPELAQRPALYTATHNIVPEYRASHERCARLWCSCCTSWLGSARQTVTIPSTVATGAIRSSSVCEPVNIRNRLDSVTGVPRADLRINVNGACPWAGHSDWRFERSMNARPAIDGELPRLERAENQTRGMRIFSDQGLAVRKSWRDFPYRFRTVRMICP